MRSQEQILYLLKTQGALTAQAVAEAMALTSMGARKHLQQLQQRGLVVVEDRPAGKGRPARFWLLSDAGHARFPDRHGELTAQLISLLRSSLGDAALDTLVSAREQQALVVYQQKLATAKALDQRLALLVQARTDEGYMAELLCQESGWLLVENHCPICAAAQACQSFCRSELQQFQQLFPDAIISRAEHLLGGERRCAYRIMPLIVS
ncbi:transcriptional regulator [Vogesella sp. DC21W]|uniref:Transcriptional regulator n=1 Tax=Vogesella aquatica TaxID=2984206 RepID=A0ABT5IYM0_9NEIS|nr:metalloregulator ArsR/SmtB family transcription factor [Vogesella aquatica]MDC7717652.1 transcriptional regulator [Vogesella aquatica]